MKVTVSNPKEEFIPFDMNIKIESLDEAKAFFAMFNLIQNSLLFGSRDAFESIRKQLQESTDYVLATRYPDQLISNGVRHSEYYK